jgi:hypothetical protein
MCKKEMLIRKIKEYLHAKNLEILEEHEDYNGSISIDYILNFTENISVRLIHDYCNVPWDIQHFYHAFIIFFDNDDVEHEFKLPHSIDDFLKIFKKRFENAPGRHLS